jgi:hypothetical protein
MSDHAVRSRLLELLLAAISRLEGFLSSNRQHPPRIAELEVVAGYLGTIGLKPDGDWLLRQHDIVYKQGYALMESEVWAVNPEGARRWGYSPHFSGETDEDRYHRRNRIRFESQRLLDHLRKLLQIVSDVEQNELAKVNAKSTSPPKRGADHEHRLQEEDSSSSREAQIQTMQPSIRVAYLAFTYAESKAGKKLQDQEAYKLLDEEGIPEGAGSRGELTDYKLPAFDTWSRQLREARKALGEQKYSPRRGRSHGMSIVKSVEIALPKDTDQ